MKANTNKPIPTAREKLVISIKAKQVAHRVKKSWCAYYDPDRVAFGKPSRCIKCCINANTRAYDPDKLDRECSRHSIVDGCLPELDEVLARVF